MRRTLKLVGVLGVVLVLVTIVSGLAVYRLVRVGEIHRFLSDEIERRTALRAELGGADFEIGWITGIVFSNLALSESGATGPAVTAQRVTARIALLPLLRRQLIFYEIRLQRPIAHFVREPDGRVPVLDQLLKLQFLKQHSGELTLDLRSVKVEDGDIALMDRGREPHSGRWRAVHVDLDIERLRGQRWSAYLRNLVGSPGGAPAAALAFDLKGAVLREGQRIGITAQGQLALAQEILEFHRAHWKGDIEIVNFPAAMAQAYLGTILPVKSIAGYLAQRIHFEGNPSTSMRFNGVTEFRQLAIAAPEMFLAPLSGIDGRATFALHRTPRRMEVARAEFRTNDLNFSLQGAIDDIDGADPHWRLNLSVLPAPALTVLKYLPLKLAASARLENAVRSIQSGHLEIKRVGFDARLTQLRRIPGSGAGQLWVDAELRDFAAAPGAESALPLRGIFGTINVANGVFAFHNFRGYYGDSRLDEVYGRYDFAGSALGKLDLKARGAVELAELKDQLQSHRLSATTAKVLSLVQELNGRGRIDLTLQGAPNAPLQFDGRVTLDRARLRYGGLALNELRGDITFTPQEIIGSQLRAELDGSPIQARLALKDYAGGDGFFDLSIDSTGIKAGVIAKLFLDAASPKDSGIVRGSVRYFGPLGDARRRKFTGDLDLFDVQLLVKPLLQPLRQLSGKIKIDEKGIGFENLKALVAGVPATVSGQWLHGVTPRLFFDFAAPHLDITYLISQLDAESSEFYANLVAEGKIALGKGRIKNFEFDDLRTRATIDHRVWRLSPMSARSAGGTIEGTTTIFDRSESLELRTEPKIQNVPIQSFLNWFGVTTTEMTGSVVLGGQLATVGKNDAERKQNLNGAFSLRIEKGTINRMRILVQILNLLDLSRWFTFQLPDLAKQGIRFRAVTGDFKVNQGVYTTENLLVDSDDLRMTGAGTIDVPKDELDLLVAVRPFAGFDAAINQIPLLGRGIAAIKNSFLVASFHIKGKIDDPTITPAPLGTVSEMFWSVLGIPKNIVGMGEGEKKAAPQEPATPQAK